MHLGCAALPPVHKSLQQAHKAISQPHMLHSIALITSTRVAVTSLDGVLFYHLQDHTINATNSTSCHLFCMLGRSLIFVSARVDEVCINTQFR
jgi:cellobiose-specific phosphotransferase system component IIA